MNLIKKMKNKQRSNDEQEMTEIREKIAKERKTRKISRQEITARLAKAKKSKREFTYF